MENQVNETEEWKHKYEECSSCLQHLENMSKDVLKEYHELKKKFEEIQQQNEKLQKKVNEQTSQLEEVNVLIEPAVLQYTKLKSKYEIEKGCRTEAEAYAAQVVQHNKKLKRQSMDLVAMLNRTTGPVSVVDLKFDEEDETKVENSYQETMNATIKELKHEIAELKAMLTKAQDELNVEKANYKWTNNAHQTLKLQYKQMETSLNQYKEAMKELSNVSQEAFEQYESLEKKYELEVKRRSFIEKKVEEFAVQNIKMKRQSDVLMLNIGHGDKLHQAMIQIDDLMQKLEDQRKYYDNEIEKFSAQLAMSIESTSLASEKEALLSEKEQLEKQIQEYEDKYTRLETQYTLLEQQFEELKRPPPPPPPPPPLPPITRSKGFLSKILSKKPKGAEGDIKAKVGMPTNADFDKAIDEMMEKIKKGKSLRSTLKPATKPIKMMSLESEKSQSEWNAMMELHNIMNKMKRKNSESDLLLNPVDLKPKDLGDSELVQAFRRMKRQGSAENSSPQKAKVCDPVDAAKVNEKQFERREHVSGRTETVDSMGNKLYIVSEERESKVLDAEDVNQQINK